VAKPNYSGEKRRKELEKQKKKEAKKQRKLDNAASPSTEETSSRDNAEGGLPNSAIPPAPL